MQFDAIVIGAGAAGIAAARALAAAGQQVVVLEARDRLGGRVWTNYHLGPVPAERGAEFIHGRSVPTWRYLRAAELRAEFFGDPWRGRRVALGDGRLIGTRQLTLRGDMWGIRRAERAIARYSGPDIALAELLAPRRLSPLARHLLDIRQAHASCATPETISALQLAHDAAVGSGDGTNWHVVGGYDRLLGALAAGLDIRLGTPVSAVDWDERGVAVTAGSERFTARRAVVTLPLALLKAGSVQFDPPLPEAKRAAITALAMQPAAKLLLRFEEPFWPRALTFLSAADPLPVWWTVRPGAPQLTAFATGPRAQRLTAHGPDAALELGLSVLAQTFKDAPQRLLKSWELVDWAAEKYTGGGYSSAPPGAYGQRAALAAACGPLHFAGEATVVDDDPATVHGALHSGERAAAEVLAASELRADTV